MTEHEQFRQALTLAEHAKPGISNEELESILRMCFTLSDFNRERVFVPLGKSLNVSKNQIVACYKALEKREGRALPVIEPEEALRKTVNRAEVNRLQEEILKTVTADTPQEVIDGFLLRTRGYSIMKVEMITLFLAQRKGTTMQVMSERRKEVLHSTSSTDPVDTIRGNSIDMVLMDEAQNWPTKQGGDTITHGSVTGRATSPLSDRAAVVSSHVDGIDLAFSNWWLDYLRDFDNIPAGAAIDKMKVAFRAGYVRGVKDAKKDGA